MHSEISSCPAQVILILKSSNIKWFIGGTKHRNSVLKNLIYYYCLGIQTKALKKLLDSNASSGTPKELLQKQIERNQKLYLDLKKTSKYLFIEITFCLLIE